MFQNITPGNAIQSPPHQSMTFFYGIAKHCKPANCTDAINRIRDESANNKYITPPSRKSTPPRPSIDGIFFGDDGINLSKPANCRDAINRVRDELWLYIFRSKRSNVLLNSIFAADVMNHVRTALAALSRDNGLRSFALNCLKFSELYGRD